MKKPITKYDVYMYFADHGRYGDNLLIGSYLTLEEAKARCERGKSDYFAHHIVMRMSDQPSMKNMDDVRNKSAYRIIHVNNEVLEKARHH
jgi:hypothetical protein